MNRLLIASATTAFLLIGAGCGSDAPNPDEHRPTTSTTSPATVTTTPAPAAADAATAPVPATSSTTSATETPVPTTAETGEPVAEHDDEPGTETIGVTEKITIVIVDSDGSVVGGTNP